MSDGPSRGWLRRLTAMVLHHRSDTVIAMAAAVLGSACLTVVPLIARQIVDAVIIAHDSPLWPWLVLLIVTAVAAFGLSYLRRYRGGRVALSVQFDLRNAMHDHLQTMDLQTLSRMPTGQLVSRANSDSALVQSLLAFFPIMSGNLLMAASALAIMFVLSPVLAIVSATVLPVLFALSYRMRTRVFPASWDAQQREGDVAQIVDEDVTGVRIVKAFGQERREVERLAATARRLFGSRMRVVRLQARYQPLLEVVPSLAQVAILALGGYLALHHHISIGTFLAFSTYVAQFVAPARQLAGILTIGQQARAGVERIFQLLDTPPAIVDAPGAVTLGPLAGRISFEDVTFGFPDGPRVLDGLTLTIEAGERVAVIGASGSGKSTLAALVSRFHDPQAGVVRVDGHDLRAVTLQSLRTQVGVAFEEPFLFSDTVRANLAYGRPSATDGEIDAAARVAAADAFIRELPRGYDTLVGERGLSLSGGQRQRIALARAILADPRVLILDDATSAVDARTEEEIHDGLRQVLAGRTTLLVAHRLSTLRLADRIVVLAGGRVAEEGTHEELAAGSAAYRSLLAGLDDADDVGDAAVREGSVEALAQITAEITAGGTTAAAWSTRPERATTQSRVAFGAPGIGAGLGPGGGSWRANLAPTPQLLARVDALRPVRDDADVTVDLDAPADPRFSLRRLVREFRRPLLLGLLLVVLDAVAGLAGPVLTKIGIDNGVLTGSGSVLFAVSAAFLVVTLADLLTQVAAAFVTGRTAQRVMLSLRVRVWSQLQRLSLDYYEREMAGRIMTRMTTDVDQFESLIENGLLAALVSLVTFIGVGAALLLLNPVLGLFTLTVVIPLAVATMIFRRRAARLYDVARERIAVVNADFQESLSGVRESQAFAHEPHTRARFHRLGADYLDTRVAAQRLVAVYFPFVQFLSACADVIVLGAGATLIARGELTTGELIAFLLYITMFFSPIQQLSQVFDAWQQTRVSVGRIAELMRLTTLTPLADRPVAAGRLRGEIALTGVRFSYPSPPARTAGPRGPMDPRLPDAATAAKPPEALRGVDLQISPGETVALVGETGAGKSTVVKLLARFYDPEQGGVHVDGRDLRALELTAFRRQLGYVPQEPFLFSGTIRDNIAYGRPDASDAAVESAARAVGAHEFIATLPGGYHQPIAERGASLSSGQRQLIALARAELVDPAILLLDEATANLDLATEARVSAAMHRVAHRRTTVVIAHRLQTARGADRIVVMGSGRVLESGSHEELLAAGGPYAAMWRAFDLSLTR